MLHNYNFFIKIYESKNKVKKIEKQKEEIYNFLKFKPIIEYVFENVVDKDGTKGLKYTTWFCRRIKNEFIDWLVNNYSDIDIKIKSKFSDISEFKNFLNKYLTSNSFSIQLSEQEKSQFENDINKLFDLFISPFSNNIKTEDGYLSLIRVITHILDWFKSPIREEKINLNELKTLKDAYHQSSVWHDNLKSTGIILNETGTILMEFDDGFYWIDLKTNSSKEEAEAMGHCGTTNYGETLYSLRKNKSPHVTVAVGRHDSSSYNTIYQIKGKNNKKPIEKYHKYILELLSYPNVSDNVKIINDFDKIEYFSTTEYMPTEDFNPSDLSIEQIKELNKRNPELVSNIGLPIKYKLYKNGLITKEELIKKYRDLEIIDGEIYFVVPDWSYFEDRIFKVDKRFSEGYPRVVLNGDFIDYCYYDDVEFDYYYYDYIKPYAFEKIIDYIDENEYILYYNIDDEEKKMLLSKDNMKYSKKEKDIIIETPEGLHIKFIDLLEEKGDFYCDLTNIKYILNDSYSMASCLANEQEAYETLISNIESKIGPLEIRDKLYFKLNFDYIIDIVVSKNVDDDSILDIINSISYYDDDLKIHYKIPYYGWYGSINADVLSDEICNRLLII